MTKIMIGIRAALLVLISGGLLFAASSGLEAGLWPHWRGPLGNGMARGDAPTHWSDTENIRWKAEIPGRGHSTPVIWNDRIFVTTAVPTGPTVQRETLPQPPAPQPPQGGRRGGGFPGGGSGPQVEHKFVVMCLDRKTGKVLWEKTAKVDTPHEGYHQMYGSFASNSPVTDGKRVYASFGSRGIFCYDLNGNLVWEKDFGVKLRIRLTFGEGAAPILYGDRLIANYDHEGESFLVALDKNTGKEIWKTERTDGTNWAEPTVVEHAGKLQIVVSATKRVRGYDFNTGKQIWECAGLGLNTIPKPFQFGDLVYAMSGYRDPKLMAIRLDREGDLTGTDAIVWSETRGLSYTASPVIHEGKIYLLTDNGVLSCLDAKTGQPFYQQIRLPKPYNFKASPIGANGKLYLASESGDVIVVKMGEKFEVVATNTLADQMFIATPVIAAGEIFLRSQNRLYCISENR